MESKLFYRNVTSAVRTPRLAVLVESNKKNWKAYVEGIVQSFTEVWGGEHFIIIPTDGKCIDDTFWKILEAYNPDYIGRYIPTFLDLKEADPATYNSVKSKARNTWELSSDEDFEELWLSKVRDPQLGGLDIDSKLSEELKNRLSPFYFQDHVVGQNVFHSSKLGYPFTQIEDIVDSAKSKPAALTECLRIDDPLYNLLSLSRTGSISDEYKRTLKSRGIGVEELPVSVDGFRVQDYISALESGEYDAGWRRVFHGGNEGDYPPDDFMDRLPFSLSLLHLSKLYKHSTHRHWEEDVHVIIGDAFEDYCLYYSLSRMHDGVYWLPDSHLNAANKKVVLNEGLDAEDIVKYTDNESIAAELVRVYLKAVGRGRDKKKINIMSMSLSQRKLLYRRRWMSGIYYSKARVLSSCRVISLDDIPTNCVSQVMESNNHANQQDVVFQDMLSVGRINTPKPKNFYPVNAADHRWVTSLYVDKFHPPSLPFLGSKIITGLDSVHETRVSKDELAYFSPNIAYFGGDIDTVTLRPTLSLMRDDKIFEDYFSDSGYATELSDKGSYLKDTIERFGSLEDTAIFFRSRESRDIFDQYLVTKPLKGDDEIVRLSTDKRTYLSFDAFRRKLNDEARAVKMIDELISKNILSRGFIFQCSRCRLSAWYGIDSVSKVFTCNRCELTQPYTYSNWKHPSEPKWYYRLSETVYLFYESSSHLTVLALDRIRLGAPNDFHYVSETNITNPQSSKPKQEIDILAISKGRIIIGECKDCPVKPADVRKYLTIFSQLNIKPAEFILATTESTITSGVQAELDKFKSYRLFTRDDLYE